MIHPVMETARLCQKVCNTLKLSLPKLMMTNFTVTQKCYWASIILQNFRNILAFLSRKYSQICLLWYDIGMLKPSMALSWQGLTVLKKLTFQHQNILFSILSHVYLHYVCCLLHSTYVYRDPAFGSSLNRWWKMMIANVTGQNVKQGSVSTRIWTGFCWYIKYTAQHRCFNHR